MTSHQVRNKSVRQLQNSHLVLLFILFCSFKNVNSQYLADNSTVVCGKFYKEPSKNREKLFSILGQQQYSNLTENHINWNNTSTIAVENDCKLEVCKDTKSNGVCHTLSSGSYPRNSTFMNNIVSAQCTCKEPCAYSDIHIKKSLCGRAYLQGDCQTLYTDLLANGEPYFSEALMKNVTAIRLRRGCTLSLYSDEGFGGNETILEEETVSQFAGIIGSYDCECDDSLYEPRVKPPRPASYPSLIDIPDSIKGVVEMLKNETYQSHPGLLAAQRSYRNGRSHKNAYVLVLGSSGAGKSHMINVLFDKHITNYRGCGGNPFVEYRFPVPIDELGIANSELRIIDTPGLGDTRGMEQDAKYLAYLENFLSTHEELKDRLPNVVLILHKFNDNRFNVIGSLFWMMLRALETFSERITDDSYSNVIFVFSHFCSETRITKRRPENKLKLFKDIIQMHSLFPRPTHIVVAENKGDDQDLPKINGFFKLPNEEYYPANLLEKVELVAKKGGDIIGLGVLKTAVRESGGNSNSTITRPNNKVNNSTIVQHYLQVLSSECFHEPVNTEISQYLQYIWDNQVNDSLHSASLTCLQKAFHLKNISKLQDLPKTKVELFNLVNVLRRDDVTFRLLEEGLNITFPVFPAPITAGYGYNVFNDTQLTMSPFVLKKFQLSGIGFMIPSFLSWDVELDTKQRFLMFENKENYLKHRLQSLGIEGIIPTSQFTDDIKPGCNIRKYSFENDSCSISVVKDIYQFEFILNGQVLQNSLSFKEEFKQMVKSLPNFNETDLVTVNQWKQFFNTYGTHVVRSVYGGGSIQIQLESNKSCDETFTRVLSTVLKIIDDKTYKLSGVNNSNNNNVTDLGHGINQTMKLIGGNIDNHLIDLGIIPVTEVKTLLYNWEKTIKYNPIVLNTDGMQLLPISEVVKKLGKRYTQRIDVAISSLFKSELKYIPVVSKGHQTPPVPRENIPILMEYLNLNQEFNKN